MVATFQANSEISPRHSSRHLHAQVLPDLADLTPLHTRAQECTRLVAKWLDEAKALQGADPELVKFLDSVVKYAEAHRDIVAKWGRFPHRNAVLGRASTEAEVQGLADGSIRSF